MQLFSSIVIFVFASPRTVKAFQMAYESTQAVMATPNDQPSLSVV